MILDWGCLGRSSCHYCCRSENYWRDWIADVGAAFAGNYHRPVAEAFDFSAVLYGFDSAGVEAPSVVAAFVVVGVVGVVVAVRVVHYFLRQV